jgi:hypothetical protein
MHVKKIAVLVAAVCAGFAGSASAALTAGQISTLDTANAGNRVFFLAGASAVQGGLTSIESSLFNAGTSFRLANTTASSKDYEAIAGTFAAGTGPWAGQTGIFIYRVKGGSVFGVNSVARAEAIETLVVKSGNCGTAGAGTAASPYTCDLSDGTVAKPHKVPDAGVSDVAPKFFQSPINTEGETPADALSSAELANFNSMTPLFTLPFGPAVTNNVSTTLTKPAVAAIMAGNVGTWNQLDAALPADDIVICRRVQGSGTQAVFNNYYGGYPCATTSNVPVARDGGASWDGVIDYNVNAGDGLQVIENNSSGDVRNCLAAAASTTAATGSSYATKNRDGAAVTVTFSPKAGGHKAIGVLSLDSIGSSNAAAATGWSFRALDGNGTLSCTGTCPATTAPVTAGTGKFPLQASLIDGTWDQQGWVSYNVPNSTAGNANKGPLATRLRVLAQNPAVLGSVNNFKWVAAALPAPFSTYSGAGVTRSTYLGGDQCAPLNRNL